MATQLFTVGELLHAAPFALHAASNLKDAIVNSLVGIILSTPDNFSLVKLVIAAGCFRILWSVNNNEGSL